MILAALLLASAAERTGNATLKVHHPAWLAVDVDRVGSALWISSDVVRGGEASRAAFVLLSEDTASCDDLRAAVASTDPEVLSRTALLSKNRGIILVFLATEDDGGLPSWDAVYGGAGDIVSGEGHVTRSYSFLAWSEAGVVLPRNRVGGLATLTSVGADGALGHVENKLFDADFVATPCAEAPRPESR